MDKEQKYIKFRKKSLNGMRGLVFERAELNAKIRKLRREMEAWDRALITE